jgi:large subunit ribosomal protein L35
MAYKYKPNKSVAKRFRATKTGKLKRGHTLTSHLRSSRDGNKKRHLRRPAILAEGHSRNMRLMMGISGRRPNKIKHDREVAAIHAAHEAAGTKTRVEGHTPVTPAASEGAAIESGATAPKVKRAKKKLVYATAE